MVFYVSTACNLVGESQRSNKNNNCIVMVEVWTLV